jgi:hypothetical protein
MAKCLTLFGMITTPFLLPKLVACGGQTNNLFFTEGKGTEAFVFMVHGNEALLYNYNINSPTLITK